MTRHQGDPVAMRVVTFLGAAGIIGLTGVIVLVYHATGFEKIDPSTTALVSGVSTLVGAALGGLGAILASTGKTTPQPVTVENEKTDPVPTAPTAEVFGGYLDPRPAGSVTGNGFAVGGSTPVNDL